MADNIKIRTPDVEEILDIKIKASNPHIKLDVIANEDYDSVLAKITARTPNLVQKQALDAAEAPSLANPYVTYSELNSALTSKIPWKTIGNVGSSSDFEGNTDAVFTTAFASGDVWFQVREGTYTFSSTVTIPGGFRIVGTSPSATLIIGSVASGLFDIQNDSYLSYMTLTQTHATNAGLVVSGDNVSLENLIVNSPITGKTIEATGVDELKVFSCVSNTGQMLLDTVTNAFMYSCLFFAPSVNALRLFRTQNVSLTGSIFRNGVFQADQTRFTKAVANHFNDGTNIINLSYGFTPGDVTIATDEISVVGHLLQNGDAVTFLSDTQLPAPLSVTQTYFVVDAAVNVFSVATTYNGSALDISSIGLGNHTVTLAPPLLRGNTPNTYNNEVDDFRNLLSYIGSPSITTVDPPFSNNYGGLPGEDLTARSSGLDLLIQWRYEERNFHLVADAEPMIVTWNPGTNNLSTSGGMRLISSHRASYWELQQIAPINIPDGFALYYVLNRNLNNTPITLTPVVAPLGSIPNNRDNRQVWVLAFALGTTLWWRGGGGSRFPGTASQIGQYFVDGSSKSILDFIGANDYNDFDPSYSNNFAGVQSENLVTRIGKTDTLIRRLYEYSNLGTYLSDAGYISVETGPGLTFTLTLSGTFYLAYPHAGRFTATNLTWDLEDTELVYFTLSQGTLAGDTPIDASAVVEAGSGIGQFGGVALPTSAYPLGIKYFVFAYRSGNSIFLWDGSELPVGGRYPIPSGRTVVPTATATTLPENIWWDGSDLRWEGLNLATTTGLSLDRNAFTDQTTVNAALTTLAEGQGLIVTHTWNTGAPSSVNVQRVNLPLVNQLNQNQFLWVQRRNNNIIFSK